ncbi:hypothetical protein L1987_71839 [Smallanthus sonchifolius]|uniref:Uncharacterized protein n=1 Tax=Smallanthus sonchifolius TaxID=185202 RepID=A0ACB9AUE9_9ASTR|nr:hypothetical protein L1987_71839 [Smallanthus sonchifolius]
MADDYLFSSIKIGDWYHMDDNDDDDGDYLNFNDVVNKLPSDPFEMNISGGCTMIRGWIHEDIGYIGDEINLDDKNGFFLFDEKLKKVLHPINKHGDCNDGDGDVGAPHDALVLALVGESFNDDSLLRITSRANGSLQSLSLVKCLKITDLGLKNVFQQNLGLIKLNVVGCNGLSMEGLLNNMKSIGGGRIKRLQIRRLQISGLHNITMDQFQELDKLLSLNNQNKPGSPKPRFYHGGQLYLSLDDNRPTDIEACPKCHQLRQVYDCPAASCNRKHSNCRACTFCIPRCTSCGCCFNERDYIETFCLDLLCLDCLTQILSFPAGEDEDINIRGFHQHQHQQASYHFCFCG